MDAKECIKTRRSIRKYTDKPVTDDLIKEAVTLASLSPSWKNTQTVKYYVITDKEKLNEIKETCFGDFEKNKNTLSTAQALFVLTTIKGIAGYNPDGSFTTEKGTHWQSFDSGCAAQTLALSLHSLGLSSVMFGMFDEDKIKKYLNIPETETVSILMPAGYPESVPETAPKRKPLEEILIFK